MSQKIPKSLRIFSQIFLKRFANAVLVVLLLRANTRVHQVHVGAWREHVYVAAFSVLGVFFMSNPPPRHSPAPPLSCFPPPAHPPPSLMARRSESPANVLNVLFNVLPLVTRSCSKGECIYYLTKEGEIKGEDNN